MKNVVIDNKIPLLIILLIIVLIIGVGANFIITSNNASIGPKSLYELCVLLEIDGKTEPICNETKQFNYSKDNLGNITSLLKRSFSIRTATRNEVHITMNKYFIEEWERENGGVIDIYVIRRKVFKEFSWTAWFYFDEDEILERMEIWEGTLKPLSIITKN